MQVKCKDNSGIVKCLTVGKIYTVSAADVDRWSISITDNGLKNQKFNRDRFDLVSAKLKCILSSGFPLIIHHIYDAVAYDCRNDTFFLKEIANYWDANRFEILFNYVEAESKQDPIAKPNYSPIDLTDWKVWARQGRLPNHCACNIPKENCGYHR